MREGFSCGEPKRGVCDARERSLLTLKSLPLLLSLFRVECAQGILHVQSIVVLVFVVGKKRKSKEEIGLKRRV